MNTDVEIVKFPDTRVAAVEYRGPERHSLRATWQLIDWRRENGVTPLSGRTYGVHYTNPDDMPAQEFRLDICVAYEGAITPNPYGVVEKVIPGGRCARLRHYGSRNYIYEAQFLHLEWLPRTSEELRDFPVFFHYVNVGPDVREEDMLTDVYLPLK